MRIEYLIRHYRELGKPVPHHSVRTFLRDLQGIKTVEFADGYSCAQTLVKSLRDSLSLFHIQEPVSEYKKDIAVPNMVKYARKPH